MNRYIALKTILEYGNFSRAADVLGYTQSAVSQMVSSLEQELGVKLLQRGRNGATLTEEGKEIYPLIEQTLTANAKIIEKAAEVQGLETGTVRIASISSVATHWLAPLIRMFKEEHPNICFQVKNGNFAGVLELLNTGLADLAFTSVDACGPYRYELLNEGRMILILPKGHPLAVYDTVPLEMLRNKSSIMLERGDYHEPTIALAELGIYPEMPIDVENDDHAIMAMVEQGLGISILSELMLKKCGFDLEMRATDPVIVRKVGAVYKDKNNLPAAAKRFLEYVTAHTDELN
jgi:DNA-binding transcriptional LysR family regulator